MNYAAWILILAGLVCFFAIISKEPSADAKAQMKLEIQRDMKTIDAAHASLRVYNEIVAIEESK